MKKQEILDRLDVKDFYSSQLPSLKVNGSDQGQALCPFHDDKEPSLSVNFKTGAFKCFGCDSNGSIFDFVMKKLRLSFLEAKAFLAKEVSITAKSSRKILKTYDYKDETGTLLYQAIKYEPKGFAQRRPDGTGGWIWNLQRVRLIPYNLPAVLDATSIIIVEGEKDAESLRAFGLVASCNAMGAGKWKPEYNEHFRGKKVAIIPDNDEPGRSHAQQVAGNLQGISASIRIVELPGLPVKGDVTDWIKAGGTKEELLEIIKTAPEWKPKSIARAGNGGLSLTSLGDLLKEPDEAVAWLVDGLLPSGGFSIIAAKPKVGKSTLARSLALCIARGEDFFMRQVQEGPVIYLALEEKRSEVKRHFKDMGANGEEPVFIFSGRVPSDAIEQVTQAVAHIKPVLLIIDPLFRFTKVKDIKDYTETTTKLEPLLMLARESGAHVACLHHNTKAEGSGGDGLLGSIGIFGTVDTLISLKRSKDYRIIESIQRYGDDLPETVLGFDKETRTITIGGSKEQTDIEKMKDVLAEYLNEKKEPITEAIVDAEVEGRRGIRKKALRALVADGRVKREGQGGKGDPFKYILVSWFPDICSEPEYRNQDDGDLGLKDAVYSGSREVGELLRPEQCHSCMLSPGQRHECRVIMPCPKSVSAEVEK